MWPTGHDAEGYPVSWQNTPNSPSTTVGYLYDGQGDRVEQQVTANGTTTTTVYIGNLEEVSTTGSTTTTTTYYYAGTARVALAVNGTFSYLGSDALGTAEVALDANGNTTAATLYAPYGTTRYASGAMPGSFGYTGQHADAATGLDYYTARYYDAVAGQFASADTALPGNGYDVWGLSRYAYVEGNPITRGDPTGHCPWCLVGAGIGAAVGFGVGVWAAHDSGQPLSLGMVAHVAADVALGATAGAAMGSGDPAAIAGGALAAGGLLLTHNGGHGGGAAGAQYAFEQIALGADAGFLGGRLVPGASPTDTFANLGERMATKGGVNGLIAFGTNVGGQLVNQMDDLVNDPQRVNIDWTSASLSGVTAGATSALGEIGNTVWPRLANSRTSASAIADSLNKDNAWLRGMWSGAWQGLGVAASSAYSNSQVSSTGGEAYRWSGHGRAF